MDTLRWNSTNKELNRLYEKIFKSIDINTLDNYEKRKIIFKYLSENVEYDYNLLENIKLKQSNQNYRLKRDPYLEVESVLKNNKGICNAIAQVYKLLLEKVGIYSMCVICDDGTPINHQLNLVYNGEEDSFSFDDITSVIVNRGDLESYFDYDMDDAFSYNQGCKEVFKNETWVCLPDEYIYTIVGRRDFNSSKKYDSDSFKLPKNISSYNKKSKRP